MSRPASTQISRLLSAVPALAVIAVLVLPVLWWLKVAFLDPDTEMLAPSSCGQWVVHPGWNLDLKAVEQAGDQPHILQSSPPVFYRLELSSEALRNGPVAEITAMGGLRVALGDRPCAEFEPERRWKQPVEVDLAACMRSPLPPGTSVPLVIRVQNPMGPAPARVCWRTTGPELPATGAGGWSAWTAESGMSRVAVAGRGMSELLDKDFTWPRGPWGYRILLAGMLLMGLVGLFRRGGASGDGAAKYPWSGALGRAAQWLVLALVVVVYVWNGLVYPWEVSRMDQAAHVQRLVAASQGDWQPPADSMFQAYQPPFYYALGGTLIAIVHPDLRPSNVDAEQMRPVQVLDALAGVVHAFLAWWVLCRFGPASLRARVLAVSVAALAPVAVTTHPMLGNESFTGVVCGLALVAGLAWVPGKRLWLAALAGLAGGLAMLSKFTGLMPVAAIGLVAGARWLYRPAAEVEIAAEPAPPPNSEPNSEPVAVKQGLASPIIWAFVVALLAGPFYVGRWLDWGDPFIGNWSTTLGYGGEAEPGYRTPGFFLRFGEVFFHAPERGMWSSFWDGLYASTWGEVNDSFVPIRDDAINAVQMGILALALVPTLAWLAGLLESIGRAYRRPPGIDLGLVAVTIFTISSVAVYTTRVPFSNTVKAVFLLSLLVPAAYFAALGYARMERGLGRARWLLDLVTCLQLLLVLRLFVWLG